MRFTRERYSEALADEMLPLWNDHHRETANKFYGPLNPQLETYLACDKNGCLYIFTARNKGILVGYQVFIVSEQLHSRDQIQAVQDVLYLKPEYRKGLTGYKFMKWCINELKNEGVDVVHQVISARNDFGKILERMGFQLEDLTYAKLLQEAS